MGSFAALMILVFVGGSFGDFNVCERGYRVLCDYTMMPDKFPVNIEELRHACGAIKTLARCVLESKETCTDETIVANFRKIVNFVDEACEEDSSIFQAISNNIKCLDDARKMIHDACNMTAMTEQHEDELYAHMDALIEAENDITEHNTFCFASKTIGRCLLEYKETCADEAETTDLRKLVNFLDEACEEDSSIFQAISNDIKCVDHATKKVDDACNMTAMLEEMEDKIYALMYPLIEAENDIDEEAVLCLGTYYIRVACPSITVGIHCGPETRDSVREVLENLEGRDTSECSEDVDLRNELEILYNLFEKSIN